MEMPRPRTLWRPACMATQRLLACHFLVSCRLSLEAQNGILEHQKRGSIDQHGTGENIKRLGSLGREFDTWDLTVDAPVKVWNVRTGSLIHEQVLLHDFSLSANRSTAFPNFRLPEITDSKVILDSKWIDSNQTCEFPWASEGSSFEFLNNLRLKICRSGEDAWVELNATVPVKGVLVEAVGQNVEIIMWDENQAKV